MKRVAALVAACLTVAPVATAQVGGTHLVVGAAGNLPFTSPDNRLSLYEQLTLVARVDRVRIGGRVEAHRTSDGLADYARLTQRYVEWADGDRLRIRAGTFTAILGDGLVFRAFEVPGVVLEDPGVRTQHAFSRDTDGALVVARRGAWQITALAGSPSAAEAPRDLAHESGLVAGGEVAVTPRAGARVGATYLRIAPGGGARESEVVSTFAQIDPPRLSGHAAGAWTLRAEYAGRDLSAGSWFTREHTAPHALHAASVWAAGRLTASLAVKDYRGFRLGANDPPSLVRQHTAALLNRGTHVLDAQDETGHQAEAVYTAPWGTLTGNWSRGDGHVSAGAGRLRPIRYDEYFGEWQWTRGAAWSGSVFADRHHEGLLAEHRTTAGAAVQRTQGDADLAVTAEVSRGRRDFAASPFTDALITCGLTRPGGMSLGLALERSDDPEFTDHADTPAIETAARIVAAVTLGLPLGAGHDLRITAGERRGGPACAAGSCYLVPAFRGAEVRLTGRF